MGAVGNCSGNIENNLESSKIAFIKKKSIVRRKFYVVTLELKGKVHPQNKFVSIEAE